MTDAFSLIEVTLAIGVVSFSMLAILAVLPVGLRTFRDSKVETALGGIQRQVRAEAVQQWTNFDGETMYFSDEGIAVDLADGPYFAATGSLSAPVVPGVSADTTNSLRRLQVKVVYPYVLPAAARTTNAFQLLLARQEGEEAG